MKLTLVAFALALMAACSENSVTTTNSASLNASTLDPNTIFTKLTVKDGLVVQSRQVIVDIEFHQGDAFGPTVYFDRNELFYANGVEMVYYETGNTGYYAAWIGLQETDTSVQVKMVDKDGVETTQNIALAEKAEITNFQDGDISPEIASGIAVQYEPTTMNVKANFNVGGGECQTNFDHDHNGSGGVQFTSASIQSEHEASLWTPGEKVYIRLQNIQTAPQPLQPFTRGEIVAKGYTNLELIVP